MKSLAKVDQLLNSKKLVAIRPL